MHSLLGKNSLSNKGQGLVGIILIVGVMTSFIVFFTFDLKLKQHQSTLKVKNYFSVESAFEQAAQFLRSIYSYKANCTPKAFLTALNSDPYVTSSPAGFPQFNVTVAKQWIPVIITRVGVSNINDQSHRYDEIAIDMKIEGSSIIGSSSSREYMQKIYLLNTCSNNPTQYSKAINYLDFPSETTYCGDSFGPGIHPAIGDASVENGALLDISDLIYLKKYILYGDNRIVASYSCLNPNACPCHYDVNQDGILDEADVNHMEKYLSGYVYTLNPFY